jgi:putative prepilin-type N-cleavage/methylation domain protein
LVKSGFSLIELILSIIIVAVVSTSIPLVLKTTSQLNQKAITQESLMNAKTYIGLILKAPFSNEIIKASNLSGSTQTAYFFPIILKPNDKRNEFYKKNKIVGDGHRLFAYTNSPELTADSSVRSVSYYATKDKSLNTSDQTRDYIVSSEYNVKVKDGNGEFKPNLALDSSDVKEIILTTISYKNDAKQETTLVLRAYAFNLGESGSLNTKAWK